MAGSALARVWTEPERDAWKLPGEITPSEWADENRRLNPKFSNESGRWRTARTPYLREIMDTLIDPLVEQVTFMKATQIGATEAVQNLVGYTIDQMPSPLLYVMPTEEDAKGIAGERLKSLVNETPAVAAHKTDRSNDLRGSLWMLDEMVMRLAWPTASKLASMPVRIVIIDEVDKIEKFTGKEANPLELARDRTDTFKSTRKLYVVSSPTNEDGHVHLEFEDSDKRRYWVPCPHCHGYQPLVFGGKGGGGGIKWPVDERDPERIKALDLAYYECDLCAGEIRDHYKPLMLEAGVWCPEGCEVGPGGKIKGDIPQTTHRGYHLSALYSPWKDFSELVAEWLKAKSRPDKLQNFLNSRLAQVWREKLDSTKTSEVEHLELPYRKAGEDPIVPADAIVITAAIDVQKDHVWVEIRAWGVGETSWLVQWLRLPRYLHPFEGETEHDQWRDVVRYVIRSEFEREDGGPAMTPRLIGIDSGHFTDEVYAFSRRFSPLLIPLKGSNQPMRGAHYRASHIEKDRRGRVRQRGIVLWWVDPFYYKPKLHRMMQTEPGMPGRWHVYQDVEQEFKDQVTAEELVIERNRRTGAAKTVWRLKEGRNANHLGDCAVYNLALADIVGVGMLTEAHLEQVRRVPTSGRSTEPEESRSRRGGSGWINRGGGKWLDR